MVQSEIVPRFVEETDMTPVEAVDYWSTMQGIKRTNWGDRRGVSQQTVSQNIDSALEKIKEDPESVQPLITEWTEATVELISQDIEGEVTTNGEATFDPRTGFEIKADLTALFEHYADPDRYPDVDIPSERDERFDRVFESVDTHLGERWNEITGAGSPTMFILGWHEDEGVDSATLSVVDLY